MVLLEDTGALIGLMFALAGIGLTILTGDPVWDGVGTIAIGVLLGVIAVILMVEMHSLLIGESATKGEDQAIRTAVEQIANVDRVIHLRTQYLGPDELLVGAKIALAPATDLVTVAAAIDAAEAAIRAAVPAAQVIYLEPDLDREQGALARRSASHSRMLWPMVRPTSRIDGTMYRLSSRLNRRRNHSARTGSVSAAPRNWSKSPPTGRYHHGVGPEARCSTRSPIAFIVHTGNVDFAVAVLNSRAGRRPATRAPGEDGPPAARSSSCPARRWG